jgi:hypothetical protein
MASHEKRSLLHHATPGEHTLTDAVEHHHEAPMIILRGGPKAMSEVSEKENTKLSNANIKLQKGSNFSFCLVLTNDMVIFKCW